MELRIWPNLGGSCDYLSKGVSILYHLYATKATHDSLVADLWSSLSLSLLHLLYCVLHTQVSHFSTTILSAMLAGMDDREDPEDLITMEAMSGLSRIFSQIDEGHVRPILINIALRIRPCFEKVYVSHMVFHIHG